MSSKPKEYTCSYCGKKFVTGNRLPGRKHYFCSRECTLKYRLEVKATRGIRKDIPNCKCDYCGKEFHKVPSAIRKLNFCSRKCQNTFLAHRIRDKAQSDLNCTCEYCGKKFHKKESHKGKSADFCSLKCCKSFLEEHRVEKECLVCGKKFIVPLSRVETSKYCSTKCQITYQRRFFLRTNCTYCNKPITVDKTRQLYSKSGLHFCSNECIGKYFRGEKSPVYKGTSELVDLLRRYYNRYQRPLIFLRDNKTCQICGEAAEHVHHITPVHKIVDRFFKQNSIDESDLSHEKYLIAYKLIESDNTFKDKNNLIALCAECHKKQHANSKTENIMNITNVDYGMSDRTYSIFLSGCNGNPKCEGCHNPENWDFNKGDNWLTYIKRVEEDVQNFGSLIDKILVVGGEPLDQNKICLEQLLLFLSKFNIPLCLFTRYSLEEVPEFVKGFCDFIKCGAFIPSLICQDNFQEGIQLATSNQKIYKKGQDY